MARGRAHFPPTTADQSKHGDASGARGCGVGWESTRRDLILLW